MADLIDPSPKNKTLDFSETPRNNNIDNNAYNEDPSLPLMASQLNPFSKTSNQIIEETFFEYVHGICCPKFSFFSTTFILSCIQIILYIITIFFGIKNEPTELIAPTYETLTDFGMLMPDKILTGHIWRILTAVLLHTSFTHLFFNIIIQLIVASYIESVVGSIRVLIAYIFTTIAGGLFSCCITNSYGTTSTLILYSLAGIYLAYSVLNFFSLDTQIGLTNKLCNVMFIMFMIMINVLHSFQDKYILSYANIGALIYSFFFGLWIVKPYKRGDGLWCTNVVWFWIGISFSFISLILEASLFFSLVSY